MKFVSLTIDRCCLFLFAATAISVVYRYIHVGESTSDLNAVMHRLTKQLLGLYDPFKCDALLTQGNWLGPPDSSNISLSYSKWSPSTCIMHEYGARAVQECIGQRKIVFIGDSQIRHIFWALVRKLDRQQAEKEISIAKRHSDLSFKGPENTLVDFLWDPYLNSTGLVRQITIASMENPDPASEKDSAIIMIGGGLWFAQNMGDFSLQRYSESVENIFITLGFYGRNRSHGDTLPETLPQRDRASGLVMFAPIQKPFYALLDHAHAKTLTPTRIQPLYEKLRQSWQKNAFPVLWAYDAMTRDHLEAYQPDGLHVVDNVADAMADLMLNVKCNSFLTATKGYPMDKTCCSRYPQLKKTQITFICAAWSFPLVAWLLPWIHEPVSTFLQRKAKGSSPVSMQSEPRSILNIGLLNVLPPLRIRKSITILSLTSYYCWLVDRTHLYVKVQKQYTNEDFTVLCLMTVVVGTLSLYRSRAPAEQKISCKRATPEDLFLSRDQTDEWKGWMQMIILIYHYTGASKVLLIYKVVRILVAAYLFLTGYGHTMFFYNKADYSLKRVAGVLIRLNLLSCILPYIMQTDYMFYYFAPLVSFWYMVVYATMAICRSWNKNLLLLILKILTSAAISTVLITWWPGFFRSGFSIMRTFFNIHWDAEDWHFRLRLDRYIVYFGMLVAAYTATNKGENTVNYTHVDSRVMSAALELRKPLPGLSLLTTLQTYLQDKRCMYLAMTCSGCILYASFTYPASNKEAHNNLFSITSIGPILAFIALRNAYPWRGYYSSVFAWIGRHSLETFVLQYHIWLAADTKGILSTGLFNRNNEVGKWSDFALLTVLFLWVCWHVADANQTLTAYILDLDSVKEVDRPRHDLPTAERGDISKGRCLNEDSAFVRGIGARYFHKWIARCMRMLQKFVAEALWVRLLMIMLLLWALNIAD